MLQNAQTDTCTEVHEKKIRNAQLSAYNYTAVIGAQEMEKGTMSIRKRGEEKSEEFTFERLVEMFEGLRVPKSRRRLEL